jgi:hypothetical protein
MLENEQRPGVSDLRRRRDFAVLSRNEEALGVETPQWKHLELTILEDLSTQAPYGVAWWAPHPGTSRRILISDQLYACTRGVLDNMLESALHLLEVLDWSDRGTDRLANVVRVENGKLIVEMPRPQNPLEALGSQMGRLHVAGTVRALAGVLDCMAGTIIGVLALPSPILKADFSDVRSLLKRTAANAGTEGERVQANFGVKLEGLISSIGPQGWLEWALAFRNMLVHRGRRIELGQFVPRTPVVYGPDGQPVLRARRVTHLPRDPGRSDVEVFLDAPNSPLLTESDDQTLRELLESTKSLVEGIAQELGEVWKWRRRHPDSLPQPAKQWPNGVSTGSIGFSGYAPGSFAYSPSMFSTHPVVAQRMRAAALDDQSRAQWKTFD